MWCQSILVVEDDSNIFRTMQVILGLEGYHLANAANGQEALKLLDSIPKPCLILLDMMMPVMNGWEFLEAVQKRPDAKDIPVVVISAINPKDKPEGVSGFLRKPVDVSDLIDTVNHYCS